MIAIAVAALVFAFHPWAFAHNGKVAIAAPVMGIVVDGSLADWPRELPVQPIAITIYGSWPNDSRDFSGKFRSGYNARESAFYLGVEIEDESSVIDTSSTAAWNTSDGTDVVLDVSHEDRDLNGEFYSPAVGYFIRGIKRGVLSGWGGVAQLQDFELGVSRHATSTVYEWRIDLGKINKGQVQLRAGMSMGLGLQVMDKDMDGSFSLIGWDMGVYKIGYNHTRGDVVLVESAGDLGEVRGAARWADTGMEVSGGKVRFQSLKSTQLRVQTQITQSGTYEVRLPSGEYQMEVVDRGVVEKPENAVALQAGSTAIVDLTVPRREEVAVDAGDGRSVSAGRGTRKGVWLRYGVADGLPACLSVTDILQDRQGNLWFATRGGGICRYDGSQFTTFTEKDGLLDNNVWCILEDREGALWFGSGLMGRNGGVSRYDGTHFTHFTAKDGLAGDQVLSMLEDRKGNLWFGTWRRGVSRFDGEHFTTFTEEDGLAHDEVWTITEDRQGNIWFGTKGSGVSRYDGERFTTFDEGDGLANNWVWTIAEDRGGNLWFGTLGGASRYDGKQFTNFAVADGLGDKEVLSIFQDQQGNLWFGTKAGGVSCYDGRKFKNFTSESGLGDNEVRAILQDREGSMWFGTKGSSVSRYDGGQIAVFTPEDGLGADDVRTILEDKNGNLWFGTLGGGVTRFDGKEFRTFTVEDGLGSNIVGKMMEDRKGNLWFANGGLESAGGSVNRYGDYRLQKGGVTRYDGKQFRAFTTDDGLAHNEIWCISEDRKGNLWFGTRGGVTRYDGEGFKSFNAKDGLASDEVWSTLEDRAGNLWFGTWVGGVSRYDGVSFKTFTIEDGIGYPDVRPILEDSKGSLWFGTLGGGVTRYDGKEFKTFTKNDGLADNVVGCMLEDIHGSIWFGTGGTMSIFGSSGGGVSRYDGTELETFGIESGFAHTAVWCMAEDKQGRLIFGTLGGGVVFGDGEVFQNLLSRDGLPNDTVWDVLQDNKGDIWIATQAGLVRYHPLHVPPQISVTDVVAEHRYGPVEEINIPTTQDYLGFDLQAKSFKTRPEAMVYRYRLRGYEEKWRTTHEKRVEYTDLPKGQYVFEVEGVDRDLTYSEKPATVKVTVHPPYGRIAWMTALTMMGGLVVWQTRRVVARGRRLRQANQALSGANKELFRVSLAKSSFLASMSHELRTPMNAILGFAQLLKGNQERNLSGQQLSNLEVIGRNAGELLILIEQLLDLSRIEAGRMKVVSEYFEIREVVEESMAVAEQLVGGRPVVLGVEYEGGHQLCYTDRTKVKQILVNLLSNAVKFTEAGQVVVRVKLEEGLVRVGVADTGIGIAAEHLETIFEEFRQVRHPGMGQGTGLGLAITRRLCRLLGGDVSVASVPGQGSTFTVTLPAEWRPEIPGQEG